MLFRSVKPDERRYAVPDEAPRHFIDIDHYGEFPFTNLPRKWEDAVKVYTEDTLKEYGIVPWHIQVMTWKLTDAFKRRDADAIVRLSADLGHYVADASVPLHTTENYNGQMTGQKGIHGFWESRLPELFGENYDYFIGPAEYLKDPLSEAWETVLESHLALDSVLTFERKLTQAFPDDKKYGFENRNQVLTRSYSYEFSKAYHEMLKGQVERRMRAAIYRVGCFWMTAWVNAGQPNLNEIIDPKLDLPEEKLDKKVKLIDRELSRHLRKEDLFGCCMIGHPAHSKTPKGIFARKKGNQIHSH